MKIGSFQLFVMIMMFHIGSTPLFQLGSKVKQNSWLAVLLAAIAGMLMMAVFVALQRKQDSASLVGLLRLTVGRWGAVAIGIVYALYFAYQSMRNVRDFGELTSLSVLQNSPIWFIMGIIMVIAWYSVVNKHTAFFLTTQLLFYIVVLSYLLLAVFVFVRGLVDFHRLLPIMEEGPMPIVRAAFPDIVSFPFTQGVVFLMFWKYAADKRSIGRSAYWGYTASAAFIVVINAIIVSVLGPLTGLMTLPLLEVVQLVQVANFVERLDVVVTLLLFIGLYIKLTAFYLAAVYVFHDLLGVSYKGWATLVGIAIYAMSFMERNNTEHIWIGLGISLKVSLVLQIAVPLLLLMIAAIRLRGGNRQAAGNTTTS